MTVEEYLRKLGELFAILQRNQEKYGRLKNQLDYGLELGYSKNDLEVLRAQIRSLQLAADLSEEIRKLQKLLASPRRASSEHVKNRFKSFQNAVKQYEKSSSFFPREEADLLTVLNEENTASPLKETVSVIYEAAGNRKYLAANTDNLKENGRRINAIVASVTDARDFSKYTAEDIAAKLLWMGELMGHQARDCQDRGVDQLEDRRKYDQRPYDEFWNILTYLETCTDPKKKATIAVLLANRERQLLNRVRNERAAILGRFPMKGLTEDEINAIKTRTDEELVTRKCFRDLRSYGLLKKYLLKNEPKALSFELRFATEKVVDPDKYLDDGDPGYSYDPLDIVASLKKTAHGKAALARALSEDRKEIARSGLSEAEENGPVRKFSNLLKEMYQLEDKSGTSWRAIARSIYRLQTQDFSDLTSRELYTAAVNCLSSADYYVKNHKNPRSTKGKTRKEIAGRVRSAASALLIQLREARNQARPEEESDDQMEMRDHLIQLDRYQHAVRTDFDAKVQPEEQKGHFNNVKKAVLGNRKPESPENTQENHRGKINKESELFGMLEVSEDELKRQMERYRKTGKLSEDEKANDYHPIPDTEPDQPNAEENRQEVKEDQKEEDQKEVQKQEEQKEDNKEENKLKQINLQDLMTENQKEKAEQKAEPVQEYRDEKGIVEDLRQVKKLLQGTYGDADRIPTLNKEIDFNAIGEEYRDQAQAVVNARKDMIGKVDSLLKRFAEQKDQLSQEELSKSFIDIFGDFKDLRNSVNTWSAMKQEPSTDLLGDLNQMKAINDAVLLHVTLIQGKLNTAGTNAEKFRANVTKNLQNYCKDVKETDPAFGELSDVANKVNKKLGDNASYMGSEEFWKDYFTLRTNCQQYLTDADSDNPEKRAAVISLQNYLDALDGGQMRDVLNIRVNEPILKRTGIEAEPYRSQTFREDEIRQIRSQSEQYQSLKVSWKDFERKERPNLDWDYRDKDGIVEDLLRVKALLKGSYGEENRIRTLNNDNAFRSIQSQNYSSKAVNVNAARKKMISGIDTLLTQFAEQKDRLPLEKLGKSFDGIKGNYEDLQESIDQWAEASPVPTTDLLMDLSQMKAIADAAEVNMDLIGGKIGKKEIEKKEYKPQSPEAGEYEEILLTEEKKDQKLKEDFLNFYENEYYPVAWGEKPDQRRIDDAPDSVETMLLFLSTLKKHENNDDRKYREAEVDLRIGELKNKKPAPEEMNKLIDLDNKRKALYDQAEKRFFDRKYALNKAGNLKREWEEDKRQFEENKPEAIKSISEAGTKNIRQYVGQKLQEYCKGVGKAKNVKAGSDPSFTELLNTANQVCEKLRDEAFMNSNVFGDNYYTLRKRCQQYLSQAAPDEAEKRAAVLSLKNYLDGLDGDNMRDVLNIPKDDPNKPKFSDIDQVKDYIRKINNYRKNRKDVETIEETPEKIEAIKEALEELSYAIPNLIKRNDEWVPSATYIVTFYELKEGDGGYRIQNDTQLFNSNDEASFNKLTQRQQNIVNREKNKAVKNSSKPSHKTGPQH